MSNQGYLRYTKSSPNTRKVFKRSWRIRGKNLCVHGEDAKRLLAYSHNTPRDIKVCISQLIIIRIQKKLGIFPSTQDGMDQAKKTFSSYCPFNAYIIRYMLADAVTNSNEVTIILCLR
jgi:hypothetical protein